MRRQSPTRIVRVHGFAPQTDAVCPAKVLGDKNAVHAFAEANGWRVWNHMPRVFAGSPIKTLADFIDHPEFFIGASGRLVGCVSHDYNRARDFSALGNRAIVERLPYSWYRDSATAYLIRPATPEQRRPGKALLFYRRKGRSAARRMSCRRKTHRPNRKAPTDFV